MNKPVHSQLEIFSETGNNAQAQEYTAGRFSRHLGKYEKAILIAVAFIITGIVSFCMGMEKGKSIVATAAPKAPALRIGQPMQPPAIKHPEPVKAPALEAKYSNTQLVKGFTLSPITKDRQPTAQLVRGFTIQLATFQSRSHAEREADGLKRKGFAPLVIPKGGYAILCVGNFSTKDTAVGALPELKKKYPDCYIRRL